MVQMKVSTIMKNSLKKAYEIASDAHKYQSDKGGKPYINHPITVSQMVKTKKAKIVALLHDVLEDSKYTKSDLEEFFTQDVCDAVQLLTREKNENYFRYITALKDNQLAREVKIADLKHNMDVSRLDSLGEKDVMRLKKYLCAYHILKNS